MTTFLLVWLVLSVPSSLVFWALSAHSPRVTEEEELRGE